MEPSRDLPGSDLVRHGIADIAAGRTSEAALLVAMAAPRLRMLGFSVPTAAMSLHAGHRLYELLASKVDDPHSRYNALVGRIVSFARAAERAQRR